MEKLTKDKAVDDILQIVEDYLCKWYPGSKEPYPLQDLLIIEQLMNKVCYTTGYYCKKKECYYNEQDIAIRKVVAWKYDDSKSLLKIIEL